MRVARHADLMQIKSGEDMAGMKKEISTLKKIVNDLTTTVNALKTPVVPETNVKPTQTDVNAALKNVKTVKTTKK